MKNKLELDELKDFLSEVLYLASLNGAKGFLPALPGQMFNNLAVGTNSLHLEISKLRAERSSTIVKASCYLADIAVECKNLRGHYESMDGKITLKDIHEVISGLDKIIPYLKDMQEIGWGI